MSTTATAAPEKNASGRSWGVGPYVRKGERDLWNAPYSRFTEELRRLGDYSAGVKLSDEAVDVAAYNLAYEAIWELRG